MNKVLKKLFETPSEIAIGIVSVLKAFWADPRSGPYICATLVALLSYFPLSQITYASSYPQAWVWGLTAAIFVIFFFIYKYADTDDEWHERAPRRTGNKVLRSIGLPLIALVIGLVVIVNHLKTIGQLVAGIDSLSDLHSIAAITALSFLAIGWAIWNYRSYNK
ncbi:MAG: hypothetical protein WCT49_00525 [Candidatus Paceibacterota bacterium]|jgi:hypothetical protein|nr:hypothetical protein [Candidatus Paceibacterota bacterium]